MHISPYGPDDTAMIEQVVDLGHAVCAADCPWQPLETVTGLTHRLRHGWDGEPPRAFALVEDSAEAPVVASGELWISEYDNLDLAWLGVGVHPARRGQGLGSRLLEHLFAEARTLGRTTVGIDGWDLPHVRRFAARHGFSAKSAEVQRRQSVTGADWPTIERLHAEAAAAAVDYELVRITGRSPDAMLPALSEIVAAINDAPTDDLDIEDEQFPVERVRDYESIQVASGRLYRIVARHRVTGELAGHTVVHVEHERPHIGHQHDTSVPAAHRGHRLGLLLKAEMIRWLHEAEPQVEYVDTWNARSNAHMITVNEALGYRVMGTTIDYQRALDPVPSPPAPARATVDA